MASLIRTIARRLARLNPEADATDTAPARKPNPSRRQRTKDGRKAETYRAAGRIDAIKVARAHRKAILQAELARRGPAVRLKPWARVSPRGAPLPMASRQKGAR